MLLKVFLLKTKYNWFNAQLSNYIDIFKYLFVYKSTEVLTVHCNIKAWLQEARINYIINFLFR